jgi:hypothetical protein
MKIISLLLMLLLANSLTAQVDKIITAVTKTSGNQENTQLTYYALDNSVIRINSLKPGKYRFRIKVDDKCKIAIIPDKSPPITAAELKEFNEYLSQCTFEFYLNDTKITDCTSYSSRTFNLTFTKD